MVGRNEPCPCGSGKKFKKCCESKSTVTIEEVQTEEIEKILQGFYDEYPKRKDIPAFAEMAKGWKEQLSSYIEEEMIEAIVLDEFFFHYRKDIWSEYLEKQSKKVARPSTLETLKGWTEPRAFIGEVLEVKEDYLTVRNIFEDERISLRRESEKPVPVGMFVYSFILPESSKKQGDYLAISSLIFIPVDHKATFDQFAQQFVETAQSLEEFLKENELQMWRTLGENGYEGGEYTFFEAGVLRKAIKFLEAHQRDYLPLVVAVEDYLFEKQPNARKDVAIAAGAIRYGQEFGLFESLHLTVKEIAEEFEVSTSSLTKYYQELKDYHGQK